MKDLITLIDAKKNDMWKMKASFLPKNINADAYFQRALFEVSSSEQIKSIAETPAGRASIYRCLCRALQMGLQVGGQFPHAYLTVRGGLAILEPSATGYKFLALSEPAIIKDIEHIAVYEKEMDSIVKGDQLTGEFEYKKIFSGERGKIAGVWFVITKLDGSKCGKWVHEDDVKKRMQCSQSYKSSVEKKNNSSPWIAWYDEMFLSKAYKIALAIYAKDKEGMNHRFAIEDDDEHPEPTEPNIESRASKHLEKVIDVDTEIVDNVVKEEVKNEKPIKNAKPNNGDSNLF